MRGRNLKIANKREHENKDRNILSEFYRRDVSNPYSKQIYTLAINKDYKELKKLFDSDTVGSMIVEIVNKYSNSIFLEDALSYLNPKYNYHLNKYVLDVIRFSKVLENGDFTALFKAKRIVEFIQQDIFFRNSGGVQYVLVLYILSSLTAKKYTTLEILRSFLYFVKEKGKRLESWQLSDIYRFIDNAYKTIKEKSEANRLILDTLRRLIYLEKYKSLT